MDNIIRYLQNNTGYLIVLGAILLAAIIIIAVINLLVKKRTAKQKQSENAKKTELYESENSNEPIINEPVLNSSSILDPLKQEKHNGQEKTEENFADEPPKTQPQKENNAEPDVKIEQNEEPSEKDDNSAENNTPEVAVEENKAESQENPVEENKAESQKNPGEIPEESFSLKEADDKKQEPLNQCESEKEVEKPAAETIIRKNAEVKSDKKSKPEEKSEAVASAPPSQIKEERVKYAGKWIITEENGRFTAALHASNGELMLSGESYSSLSGCKSGIETLKKNIENDNYAINVDKNGNFVFKIFSTANRLLCVGEGYDTREQCEKAFASVKRFAKTATVTVA